VANTLKSPRNGAVGFIDWLGEGRRRDDVSRAEAVAQADNSLHAGARLPFKVRPTSSRPEELDRARR
jgi:hypothetical protein